MDHFIQSASSLLTFLEYAPFALLYFKLSTYASFCSFHCIINRTTYHCSVGSHFFPVQSGLYNTFSSTYVISVPLANRGHRWAHVCRWRQIAVDGEWKLAADHTENNMRKHLKSVPISPLSKSNFCPFNIRLASCTDLKSMAQIKTMEYVVLSVKGVCFSKVILRTGFG